VEEAGALIRSSGNAIYALDARQSVGQIPVKVKKIGCEVMTATGRKYLRAPRGTGFSFVSSRRVDRVDPPGIDGHSAFLDR
jgi:selenocysteine lyase/cysteine desulfurase